MITVLVYSGYIKKLSAWIFVVECDDHKLVNTT